MFVAEHGTTDLAMIQVRTPLVRSEPRRWGGPTFGSGLSKNTSDPSPRSGLRLSAGAAAPGSLTVDAPREKRGELEFAAVADADRNPGP